MNSLGLNDSAADEDAAPDEEDPIELPFQGVIYVRRDILLSLLTDVLERAQCAAAVANTQQPSDLAPMAPSPGWPADATAFGTLLRERRTAAALTRAQLSRQSGIAPATIRNIECQRHNPTANTRRMLMKAFEILPRTLDS